jgi:hypothetical protein
LRPLFGKGDLKKALEFYQAAEELKNENSLVRSEITFLFEVRLWLGLNKPEIALKLIQDLPQEKIIPRQRLVYLQCQAAYCRWQKDYQAAAGYVELALQLAADMQLKDFEWRLQLELAEVYRVCGKIELSQASYQAAELQIGSILAKMTQEKHREAFQRWVEKNQPPGEGVPFLQSNEQFNESL